MGQNEHDQVNHLCKLNFMRLYSGVRLTALETSPLGLRECV